MALLDFLKNKSKPNPEPCALVMVENLCVFSFFPLLYACLKWGPASVYYLNASSAGLTFLGWFRFFGLVSGSPQKVEDVFLSDTPNCRLWESWYQAIKICKDNRPRIKQMVEKHLTGFSPFYREVCVSGVSKCWQLWVEHILLQLNLGRVLISETNASHCPVVLVSHYASLAEILNINLTDGPPLKTVSQPFQNKALPYLWAPIFYSMCQMIVLIFRSIVPNKQNKARGESKNVRIGIGAAWGIPTMNKTNKRWVDDFFWWRETRISADRLVYLFERESYQPTKDKLNVLAKLGVSSVLLDTKFAGDAPQLFFDCLPQSLKKGFDNLMTLMKLNFRSWFSDPYSRSVISLIGWQVYHAAKLANIYSSLNLRGIFHHEEAGLEFVTLASEQAGAIRIGTHWSCLSGLNHSTTRNHHIFFVWGEHDAQIVLDSQSTSKYLIMSGCLLSDQTDDEERQKGFEAVQKMKSSGVKYVLALFDNSPPLPNFYRYFFNWLLEDPELGLLLKSKKSQGALMKIGDLDGLMPRAMESGRMFSMDPSSSPADAGMIADFCVGITAISAVCTAALKGARVLYLDYEGLDRGSQKPYSILHSLGPGRCVFQDPDSLRQAVRNHFLDPKTSPELGDVTPILDRLDPFRDGKAGQRIGEFVACYLEELDNCLSSDDAVRSAADKYAEKWGQDKVIRIN